jgi:hypothetical protein
VRRAPLAWHHIIGICKEKLQWKPLTCSIFVAENPMILKDAASTVGDVVNSSMMPITEESRDFAELQLTLFCIYNFEIYWFLVLFSTF